MRRVFATITVLAAAGALVCLATCGDEPERGPRPPAPDVVLEIDGLRVTRGEIEEWYPYFDAVDPRIGRSLRILTILQQHVLPQKLAQRAFRVQRAELRLEAEGLARVAVTYSDLVELGKDKHGIRCENPCGRGDLPLVLARAAFDGTRLGQVTGVIETPQGFALVSTRTLTKGPSAPLDQVETYLVPFYTHDGTRFETWWRAARESAGARVTYVHPDYKDGLPDWIKP